MYSEGHNPCIESPLAAMNSLQEIYLQSWGNRIRIFPSVPKKWQNAVFANFSAEGGINVSAVRSNGLTSWIGLTLLSFAFIAYQPQSRGIRSNSPISDFNFSSSLSSAKSVNITLSNDLIAPYSFIPSTTTYTILSNGDLQITLLPLVTVLLYCSNNPPQNFSISPLPGNPNEYNYWGARD